MRVLLIKPSSPTARVPAVSPVSGLLQLAAAVEQHMGGAATLQILDMRLPTTTTLTEILDRLRPDVVGLSALNCEAAAAIAVAHTAKERNPQTVTALGGPYAHRRAAEILHRHPFDWVFDGEAERTFPAALDRLARQAPLGEDIPGLSYRRNGDPPWIAAGTDMIADLDTLPWAAWRHVDFDAYARLPNMNNMLKGRRYAPLFTSRGCPYTCNYCHDIFGKRFRCRSVDHVLGEIALLHESHGVDEFHIIDDIFNLHKPRLKAIMGEVARRWPGRLHFCFPNGVRSDLLDDTVLDALAAGGTYAMSVAIETATPRLQQLTQKRLDISRALWSIDAADRRGILVRGFFMIGFPTETPAEMQDTVRMALRSRLTLAHFFTVVPQPATPLHDLARRENSSATDAADCTAESALYHEGPTWYERAYGVSTARVARLAYLRFYLAPRRIWRILRRVPRGSLLAGLRGLIGQLRRRRRISEAAAPPEGVPLAEPQNSPCTATARHPRPSATLTAASAPAPRIPR